MLIHVTYINMVRCFTFCCFTTSLLRPGLGTEPRATKAQPQGTACDPPCHDDSEAPETPEMPNDVHVFCSTTKTKGTHRSWKQHWPSGIIAMDCDGLHMFHSEKSTPTTNAGSLTGSLTGSLMSLWSFCFFSNNFLLHFTFSHQI